MDSKDVERLARLTKGAVRLGVMLALVPLRRVLRTVHPPAPPLDEQRWAHIDPDAPFETPEPVAAPVVVAQPQPEPAPEPDTGPGPEIHVEPPFPDYDGLTVAQIRERLRGADPATTAMARLYEETHKNRRGVLQATE